MSQSATVPTGSQAPDFTLPRSGGGDVSLASQSLRDLRVAEVSELDVTIENGKVSAYRAKVNVSFKYEGGG